MYILSGFVTGFEKLNMKTRRYSHKLISADYSSNSLCNNKFEKGALFLNIIMTVILLTPTVQMQQHFVHIFQFVQCSHSSICRAPNFVIVTFTKYDTLSVQKLHRITFVDKMLFLDYLH